VAATPSTMLPLSTVLPPFRLPDAVSGTELDSGSLSGRPVLVMFICNHCPFVKHIRDQLASLGRDYVGRADVIAISSNDVENYPDDSPEMMKKEAAEAGYSFPYLFDESQDVAKAFSAACTPDFFLFDTDHRLVYRGQLDSSRPNNGMPVTGDDLRAALDAAIAGESVSPAQVPSIGCNIKWKPGNAPG
jgi:thiol-disulfide isomerase/thioredoxin